jgi:predicted Zn-dependent protease
MNVTAAIDEMLGYAPPEDMIVIVRRKQTANLRWANTTLTTNGATEQLHVSVFAVSEGRVGSVISSLDERTDLKKLAEQARQAARSSQPAFDAAPILGGDGVWPSTTRGKTAGLSMGRIDDDLAGCFAASRKAERQLFGYGAAAAQEFWLATSKGLRKHAVHDETILELNLKSPDFKQSVWAGATSHRPEGVDAKSLFAQLERKMEWSAKKIELPAGKYETLLEPSAVADLLIYGYWSSAARDADEGRSLYSRPGGKNAIGEKLYGEDITIYSDPAAPGMEVPPFLIAYATSAEESVFDNGLELTRTDWVKDGVQQALITPRYWAARQKRTATPWIENLIFDHPSGPTLEEMIAGTKDGLLVTCLWYIREVDPRNLLLTGLTRDGVFVVKNGKVVGATNNFRFNMSPVAMLQQAAEIGAAVPTLGREFGDYFSFATMPPLRVRDFNMSTVSDAI